MTLEKIIKKIRRVTGRISESQITSDQVKEYIADFFANDFPRNIVTDALNTTFEFFTDPNISKYPLKKFNTKNLYYSFQPPVYVAGKRGRFFQNKEHFYANFGNHLQTAKSIQGKGTNGEYKVQVGNAPILQNKVTISALDDSGHSMHYVDVPNTRETGSFRKLSETESSAGKVDYLKGEISITFPNAVPANKKIYFSYIPYVAAEPQAILFADDAFFVLPVPDRSYLISMSAQKNPETIEDFPEPILTQWWQYLALGAAKKIFEDIQDMEGVQSIMPAFKEQEALVLRRTLEQNRNQRTPTIYTNTIFDGIGNDPFFFDTR